MRWRNMWLQVRSHHLMLVPIMGLAFYVAFIPHLNYPYPVHIDEWLHLAYAKAMSQAGSTTFIEPFFGQSMISLSTNLEAGFHLFLNTFQSISGISWLTIFRYLPGVIFVFTVLSVYILARRQGFGWEAALMTCLILTTVGILGPAFLVPVSLGLLFVPLALFLAFNFKNMWSYLALFIFTGFLLSIHAPSAISLVIILGPYALLNLKGDTRHGLSIGLALVLPFLIIFPWIVSLLLPTAKGLLTPQAVSEYVQLPRVIVTYGYLPILLCLLGTGWLAMKGDRKSYGLVLGMLSMLLMLAVSYSLHYGVPIVYQRGLMFMMLIVSIVAGAGLMAVKNIRLPTRIGNRLRIPAPAQNIGRLLCLVLVVLILAIGIPTRQSLPYYNMIDQQDYEAFVWIRDNVSGDYDRAILDPWKATAFTAITGKYVYTRIHSYPKPIDQEAYAFLQEGCIDTAFLRENSISIVYNREPCSNPDLTEVRENVYLLREAGDQ